MFISVLNFSFSAENWNLNNQKLEYFNGDQSDQKRGCKLRNGNVNSVIQYLNTNGIFWMRPRIEEELYKQYFSLRNHIADYIHKTKAKPYSELNIEPKIGQICFVCFDSNESSYELDWGRGIIEYVNQNNLSVRLMDHLIRLNVKTDQIYVYKKLPEEMQLGFLAIRCCISKDRSIQFSNKAHLLFKERIQKSRIIQFKLIEEVIIDNMSCWFTLLSFDGETINDLLINLSNSSHHKNAINQGLETSLIRSELKAIKDQDLVAKDQGPLKEQTLDSLNGQNESEDFSEDFEKEEVKGGEEAEDEDDEDNELKKERKKEKKKKKIQKQPQSSGKSEIAQNDFNI